MDKKSNIIRIGKCHLMEKKTAFTILGAKKSATVVLRLGTSRRVYRQERQIA